MIFVNFFLSRPILRNINFLVERDAPFKLLLDIFMPRRCQDFKDDLVFTVCFNLNLKTLVFGLELLDAILEILRAFESIFTRK